MEQPSGLDRFLARLKARSELGVEESRAVLALSGREVRTKARGVIVRPGQDVDFSCLVIDGLLCRFDELDRKRQITALHIPGDMCDLHSVVVPHAGWGIEALTATTTLQIPHTQLCELALSHHRIAFAFWRDTVADASVLSKWVGAIGRRRSTPRVAHLLCELGVRLEHAHLGRRTHFRLHATQAQIADVLGLTNVRVSGCFSELERDRVIRRDGRQIEVLNLDRLVEIARFEPDYLLLQCDGRT